MPRAQLEPTILVFEIAKTFCALDRAATVLGYWRLAVFYFIFRKN
jgi:hypothetical protein